MIKLTSVYKYQYAITKTTQTVLNRRINLSNHPKDSLF